MYIVFVPKICTYNILHGQNIRHENVHEDVRLIRTYYMYIFIHIICTYMYNMYILYVHLHAFFMHNILSM